MHRLEQSVIQFWTQSKLWLIYAIFQNLKISQPHLRWIFLGHRFFPCTLLNGSKMEDIWDHDGVCYMCLVDSGYLWAFVVIFLLLNVNGMLRLPINPMNQFSLSFLSHRCLSMMRFNSWHLFDDQTSCLNWKSSEFFLHTRLCFVTSLSQCLICRLVYILLDCLHTIHCKCPTPIMALIPCKVLIIVFNNHHGGFLSFSCAMSQFDWPMITGEQKKFWNFGYSTK
jgi:hypothetical protein